MFVRLSHSAGLRLYEYPVALERFVIAQGHCPTQHCALCVNSHTVQRYMDSLQTTWCCSKRFGFFRLPHDLPRRPLSDTAPCCVCELTYSTAVYGQSSDDMVLLEALRFFPAALRTFTKATVRRSSVLYV